MLSLYALIRLLFKSLTGIITCFSSIFKARSNQTSSESFYKDSSFNYSYIYLRGSMRAYKIISMIMYSSTEPNGLATHGSKIATLAMLPHTCELVSATEWSRILLFSGAEHSMSEFQHLSWMVISQDKITAKWCLELYSVCGCLINTASLRLKYQ